MSACYRYLFSIRAIRRVVVNFEARIGFCSHPRSPTIAIGDYDTVFRVRETEHMNVILTIGPSMPSIQRRQ